MKYLLDTMIVSEPTKLRPSPSVVAWLANVPSEDIFISAVTVGEVFYGVGRLPEGRRREALNRWLDNEFMPTFATKVVPFDASVARAWSRLRIASRRTLSLADALLAATAISHGLTIVTRNLCDFEDLPVPVFNPFT